MRPLDVRPKDLRLWSIVPRRALLDERINKSRAFLVLACVCSYTNRDDVTFVSQERLAKDLGVSRAAISRQMKILRETGYLEFASKQFKNQTTQSVRVVMKNAHISNLSGAEQIKLREEMEQAAKEAGTELIDVTPEVTGPRRKVVTPEVTSEPRPVTPEVTRVVTSNVTHNENINVVQKPFNDLVKVYCNHFLNASNVLGQARRISTREQQLMSTWISHGLLEAEWKVLLNDQVKRCQSQRKDWPQSLAWFAEPVKSSLRRVPNATARSALNAVKNRSQKLK